MFNELWTFSTHLIDKAGLRFFLILMALGGRPEGFGRAVHLHSTGFSGNLTLSESVMMLKAGRPNSDSLGSQQGSAGSPNVIADLGAARATVKQ